jgi:hypothetical protein
MATIIVRTNPDPNKGRSAHALPWSCSQCRKAYETFEAAKTCAEADYKRRTGRDPVAVEVAA